MSEMATTVPLIVITIILLLPAFRAQYAVRRNAHDRGLRLLKQWLSAEQLACYERFAFLT